MRNEACQEHGDSSVPKVKILFLTNGGHFCEDLEQSSHSCRNARPDDAAKKHYAPKARDPENVLSVNQPRSGRFDHLLLQFALLKGFALGNLGREGVLVK